jgi:2-haloacid dehalogenase
VNKPQAYLFDAYGTLFDIHSVVPGELWDLSRLWRQKQLEATWLLALMERYRDFWEVTGLALRSAARELSLARTESQVDALMQGYLAPDVFPEVRSALDALQGSPLGILSNGSPGMLEAAVRAHGLESHFAHLISVDRVRIYKPSPRVYALGTEALKLPAEDILFVSSNWWDVAGAKAFGYRVCWCNRSGAEMEAWGPAPDYVVSRLDLVPGLA